MLVCNRPSPMYHSLVGHVRWRYGSSGAPFPPCGYTGQDCANQFYDGKNQANDNRTHCDSDGGLRPDAYRKRNREDYDGDRDPALKFQRLERMNPARSPCAGARARQGSTDQHPA